MKKLLLAVAMSGVASGAWAQARLVAPSLSCAQAQRIVIGRGAAVLWTGPHTYDRYVRDRGFCEIDEYTDPAAVPTRDAPQCFIGYICRSGPRYVWDD